MSVFESLTMFNRPIKTKAEMMKEGGLVYNVRKVPVYAHLRDERVVESERHVMVMRYENDVPICELGMVRKDYGIVQNDEVAEICDVWNTANEAKYLAAAALNKGERIVIVMQSPEVIKLGPNDEIRNTFFVTSAHDGSESIFGYPAPLHTKTDSIIVPAGGHLGAKKIKHSKHVKRYMEEATIIMARVQRFWGDFQESCEMLIDTKITDEQAMTYLGGCLRPKTAKPGESLSTRAENIREEMFAIYKGGPVSNDSYADGTMFGAYLSVVHYADHMKVIRHSKLRSEKAAKVQSLLMGDSARLKAEGLGFAISLNQKMRARK